MDGLKKLYQDGETAIYYITAENENYVMPAMPEGAEEGIIKGIYKALKTGRSGWRTAMCSCLVAERSCRSVLRAQQILKDEFNVGSNVWSVTSYTQLRRDADECQRWNMLHPTKKAEEVVLLRKSSQGS